MEIYTGFLSGTKKISAPPRVYMDSRHPQFNKIIDFVAQSKNRYASLDCLSGIPIIAHQRTKNFNLTQFF